MHQCFICTFGMTSAVVGLNHCYIGPGWDGIKTWQLYCFVEYSFFAFSLAKLVMIQNDMKLRQKLKRKRYQEEGFRRCEGKT